MTSEHTLNFHQERTYCSGILSVTSTFRLLVTGSTELKHLERLIRILRVQKAILEEEEMAEPDACWLIDYSAAPSNHQ